MKKSLAERLLAEEVPNNKVPDGKEFPEWDKAGTPPSQIDESDPWGSHEQGPEEVDTVTVSIGKLIGPGVHGMVEFEVSPNVDQEQFLNALMTAISQVRVDGISDVFLHPR